MNWWQKLVNAFFVKAQAVFGFVPKWMRWSFTKISFNKLVEEGYKINSAVSACVTTLAFSFPEPPLLAGTEVDGRFVADYSHPIMDLIRNPNPDMGDVEWLQFAITYASIGGNLYGWKQRSQNGRILAIWPFSDAQITPKPGRDTSEGFVRYYEYDSGDGQKIPIPKEDIIHWKWMPDPLNPWKGIGAIELSAREVDKDNEATAYIYALLKNNAVPPVVITLAEGDEFTQDKADRLSLQWIQKYARGEGRGGPAFIEYGMKVEKMGFNLHELAAETLNAVPESRISANFRVPSVVAGLSVGLKRSDYGDQAARRSFTELTLAALWRALASELFNGLKKDFNLPSNFKLQFDLRQVRALQEEESKLWERTTLAFNRSLITRGEAKQSLGMEPKPEDNVYFVSLASEFVPAGEAVIRSDQQDESGKALTTKGTKGHKGNTTVGRGLQRIRKDVAGRMGQAVDVYFSQLADRVVERAGKAWDFLTTKGTKGHKGFEEKDLPRAGDLLNADDRKKLDTLVKRFYVQILELSWNTWNFALGVEKAFDLEDPLVTRLLEMAGTRVKDIHDVTLQEIRDALKYGGEQGWSVDQLVRGDENQPGLRSIVDEVYKDRARTIARTELGEAQNAATVSRYKEAGVGNVEIFDNGNEDDDDECKIANGQIWSLSYFAGNTLEHPNCTRAAAPVFDDVKPDRS